MEGIILTTNIYEKSFRSFLSDLDNDFFSLQSKYIRKKIISVNNLNPDSLEDFIRLENRVKEFFPEVEFVFSRDYKNKCSDLFNVNLSEGEVSYFYSIHNYTSLCLGIESEIDFVLTLGADCKLSSLSIDLFIKKSIGEIKKDPFLLSTTLPWSENFEDIGKHEENLYPIDHCSESFYLSKVMSDQVFLCSSNKILSVVDFNIQEILHPYPGYGYGGFENRLCNFMIKNNYLRGIFKEEIYYRHHSY